MPLGGITQSVSRTLRSAGRQVYHYGHFLLSSSSHQAPKAVEIQLRSIALPLLTGSLLLYNYGEEQTHPHGDTRRWFRLLSDSTIAFLLLDKAKGLYPIAGIITGAYRAGKSGDTLQDKVRELVNTASTFVAGWFGVFLGKNLFTEPAFEVEDLELYNNLSSKNKAIIQKLRQEADIKVKTLGKTFEVLRKLLHELYKEQPPKNFTPAQRTARYQKLKKGIETFKELSFTKLNALTEAGKLKTTFQPGHALWEELVGRVKYSQETLVKFSRTVNPICCFLLTATFIGTPLALFVNKLLNKALPHMNHTHVPKMFPLPNSSLKPSLANHGHPGGRSHTAHELPNSGLVMPSVYVNGVGELH